MKLTTCQTVNGWGAQKQRVISGSAETKRKEEKNSQVGAFGVRLWSPTRFLHAYKVSDFSSIWPTQAVATGTNRSATEKSKASLFGHGLGVCLSFICGPLGYVYDRAGWQRTCFQPCKKKNRPRGKMSTSGRPATVSLLSAVGHRLYVLVGAATSKMLRLLLMMNTSNTRQPEFVRI